MLVFIFLQGTSSPKLAKKMIRVGAKAGSRTDRRACILLTMSKTSSNDSSQVNKCEEKRRWQCGWKPEGSALFSTPFLPVGEGWTGAGDGWRQRREKLQIIKGPLEISMLVTDWPSQKLVQRWKLTAGFQMIPDEEDHRGKLLSV